MFHGDRLYRGYRVIAADGSDTQIPTDPTDAETFFLGSNGQAPFNITKIAALYDLLNHTYDDVLIKGKTVANENKLLVEMVKRSKIREPVIPMLLRQKCCRICYIFKFDTLFSTAFSPQKSWKKNT